MSDAGLLWVRVRSFVSSAARALVTALALATAAGLALDVARPGSAIHPLWMGTLGPPFIDAMVATAFAGLVLLRRPIEARWPRRHRVAARAVAALVAAACAIALARHAHAIVVGRVAAVGLAPPVALVALGLVVSWMIDVSRPLPPIEGRASRTRKASAVAVATGALVLVQIAAIGSTDYRAPADAILVLGSKVHADGRPSGSLVDRTRTACALWRAGLATTIVLSGGRGDALRSEPQAMRAIALAEGVPDTALVLDESGTDTEASVRFMATLARDRGWSRVLAVSHDYHLARVRLLAARDGLRVRTVPASETFSKGWKAIAVPREVLAYLAAWAL